MSKQLASLFGGAIVLSEAGGAVTLAFDKSAMVGGGSQAGILSMEGQGSITFQGKQEMDALFALLIAHSPSSLQPIEEGAKLAADAAVSAL